MRYTTHGAVLMLAAAAALACDSGATGPRPGSGSRGGLVGPRVAVGDGFAWTELAFDGNRLLSAAVVLDEAALTGLPASGPAVEYVLPLPANAPPTVFDHVGLDWQPQGHAPPMVYTRPHFDVHFYMISQQQRDAMTPADPAFAAKSTQMPAPDEIPPDYVPDAAGVPRMGNHWMDAKGHEFHGGTFTNTLVYGFYEGKMVFIEPMVALDYLLTQPTELQRLSLPARYPKPGAYPREYGLIFDDVAREYLIYLTDFVVHD